MDYKEWINNEYTKWIEALKESTVFNFKEHLMVQKMLGEFDGEIYAQQMVKDGTIISLKQYKLLETIDSIGYAKNKGKLSGTALRMLYYAIKVVTKKPKKIIEIGGGVGEFYAILRALGYTGYYYIYDLISVKEFQNIYLEEVNKQTGLHLNQEIPLSLDDTLCISFYALGEFDNDVKAWYIENVVNRCKHGFIIWNPHSGATPDINFKCEIVEVDECPTFFASNKQLTW